MYQLYHPIWGVYEIYLRAQPEGLLNINEVISVYSPDRHGITNLYYSGYSMRMRDVQSTHMCLVPRWPRDQSSSEVRKNNLDSQDFRFLTKKCCKAFKRFIYPKSDSNHMELVCRLLFSFFNLMALLILQLAWYSRFPVHNHASLDCKCLQCRVKCSLIQYFAF